MLTTQAQVRRQFWLDNPHLFRKNGHQNEQTTDTRVTWCEYIETLQRAGAISAELAQRVTL